MIKIEIKHRLLGSVLFGCKKENNTLKDTLIEAVKRGTYLEGADLRGADSQLRVLAFETCKKWLEINCE